MNLKNMRECDKSKNTFKQQLPIVYISFNNVGQLIRDRNMSERFKCFKCF